MQVLPHLINGKVDSNLTDLICQGQKLFMDMYTRNAAPVYTEKSLKAIDTAIKKLVTKMKLCYPDTNLKIPKVHALKHFTDDVKCVGHPRNVNSAWFEADHLWVKKSHM